MRPSYCFQGATPTHWLSRPITSTRVSPVQPSPCFHIARGSGVSRLVSGGFRLDKGISPAWVCSRPRPAVLFACAQAFVLALPHTCALLLPCSFTCLLEGSGRKPRFRSIRPSLPNDFHRPDSSLPKLPSAAFRIEPATSSTFSRLPSTAMPCLAFRHRQWATTGGAWVSHLRLSLLGWSITTPSHVRPLRRRDISEEGEAAGTMESSYLFTTRDRKSVV